MRLGDLDRLVTAERVRNYSLILVAGYVLAAVISLARFHNGLDPAGRPVGTDFITFYAASELAGAGHPEAVFDMARIAAAERAVVPALRNIYLWHYPPTFEVFVAPLAQAPYVVSLGIFLAVTFALYLALARQISSHPWSPLLAAAFPAVFINTMHGQNGFLTAALLGFGLLLLDRRPWVAGVCLGLLIYKPHFGAILPFLLLAQGRWRPIAGAAATASALCAASLALYGVGPWKLFVSNTALVSRLLEGRILPWAKIPSIFVAAADTGLPFSAAYLVHGLVALVLAGLTIVAWRRPGPQTLKVALAIPAVLSVSPYCFDYDLVMLAIPIGLLAEYGRTHKLRPGVVTICVLGFVTPIAFTYIAQKTKVHLMPLGWLGLYWACWIALKDAAAATGSFHSAEQRQERQPSPCEALGLA